MPDFRFTPTEDQWVLLNRNERFLYAIAGIQGGKTYLGAIWSAMQISEHPTLNGLICAPTYKILQQSTLPKFFEVFPLARQWYKRGDNEIKIPNGGTVYVRSTEEPKHIEGMSIGWAWPDEIGQMKKEAHTNIQGRLSIVQGRMLGTTSPYALNWLYTDIYKPWAQGRLTDTFIHQWRSIDNPYFPKDEYERAKGAYDRRTFARRYEGKFEKMEGLVYEEFDIDRNVISALPPTKTKGSPFVANYVGGVDFGYNNPSCILAAHVTRDGEWYFVDEWYQTGKTTPEIIEKCKGWEVEHGTRYWYPDPAEPDRIEEMKRAGLYVRDVSKNITDGINSVRQLFREKRIFIMNTCPSLVEELSTYHYPEPTGIGAELEKPVKMHDHAVDAMRYMIHSFQPSVIDDLRQKMRSRLQSRRSQPRAYQFE